MRIHRRHAIVAGLVLMVTLGAGAGPATAQDDECASAVWAAPIEALDLPDGWSWSSLDSFALGGWTGSIEMSKAGQDDEYETNDSIGFTIICVPDPLAYVVSGVRARSLFPDEFSDIGAKDVGDRSEAYRRTGRSSNHLHWANGAVAGEVFAQETVDWAAVEELALAIDAMLP